MLHRTPILGGSFAALLALLVAPAARRRAHAEPPVYTTTWSQEALEGVEHSGESPELRTLRLAEEELFAKSDQQAPGKLEGDCLLGVPDEASAARPPLRLERPEGAVELDFLQEIELPNIPVRWDRRVLEYLLFFKDDPRGRELAASWLKRQERYGPMVRRILAEHSLPADLQYVAMVESGYDPLAHSAADAWGMWQFVKQPAVYYGLRVDHWADERLDPERSTRAAARFLRDLYERFESWELAFASYNMGYGGLVRSIRKYNTNDYWLLSNVEAGLPFETSLYVAKIMAMAIVAHNPARFGFEKLSREPSLELAKVDVASGTPLKQIASAAGITLEALQAVNPHLKQSRVPPGEPDVQIYVPKQAQVHFAQHWSSQPVGATPQPYVLRFGETLEDVARRSATTVQRLRELNELAADALPGAGFALFVPPHARPSSDLVEPLVASVPAREFRYEDKRRLFYRVAPQDTVSSVAHFFDVSVDELTQWNSLAERAALHPGMLLQLFVAPELDLSQAVVFTPDEVRILTVGSNEFFDHHELARGRVRVRYRVQQDDTMAALAERFDLSVGSIGRINQFASNRELKADEWLTVYVPIAQVEALEGRGLVERIGPPASERTADKRVRPTPEQAAKRTPELPEAEGEPLLEPLHERPITPPPPKRRTVVAAPARPVDKAAKRPPKRPL